MAKYSVLTREAASSLGVIDAEGNELGYSATRAQVESAAVALADTADGALATAVDLAPGEDLWLIDDDGHSKFFAGIAH